MDDLLATERTQSGVMFDLMIVGRLVLLGVTRGRGVTELCASLVVYSVPFDARLRSAKC